MFSLHSAVELHCLHGVDVPTIDKLTYGKGFPDESPSVVNGQGDGTVNLVSLQGKLQKTAA